MCNRRCCCPNYFFHASPDNGGTTGDMGLRSIGQYPGNRIIVNTSPTSQDGLTLVSTPFAIDYRSGITFQETRIAGAPAGIQNIAIMAEDMKLTQASRRLIFQWQNVNGAGGGAFCPDWYHQRLYYVKGVQAADGSPDPNQIIQIRRVNYDGTGDTLLYSDEEQRQASGGNFFFSLDHLVWEPRTNSLYFRDTRQAVASLPDDGIHSNYSVGIRRIDADSGGGSTLILYHSGTTADTIAYGISSFALGSTAGVLITLETQTPNTVLNLRDFNGNLASTMYTGSRVLRRCKVNESDDMVYFEEPPGSRMTFWKTAFASFSDADWQQVFNSNQTGLFGVVTPSFFGIGFGCGTEHGKGSYAGAGYGLNV